MIIKSIHQKINTNMTGLPLFDLDICDYLDSDPNAPRWDVYSQHIIAAENEEQAKEMAREIAADEGSEAWQECIVEVIADNSTFTEPTVVCSSYHAG